MKGIISAWGRILGGYNPLLSIEVTRECPLACPGCYAYNDQHLGGGMTLRSVSDLKGQPLVDGILELVRKHKPLHVSLIGGEPLVRYRELSDLLPALSARGIHTQVVTSAVRPIPESWASIKDLQICVSVDGLQPEHDQRRKPATYDRIQKHIKGHQVTVHWTITRQQLMQEGYMERFVRFWSEVPETKKIWTSLYTPQIGEESDEKLNPQDRLQVVAELLALRRNYPKLDMPEPMLGVYKQPPGSPSECIFARTTTCVSADLTTRISPCQFGGNPDCNNCGCAASAGMAAIGRHRLPMGIRVGALFDASIQVGKIVYQIRNSLNGVNSKPALQPQPTVVAEPQLQQTQSRS